jgi:hypothetical protein
MKIIGLFVVSALAVVLNGESARADSVLVTDFAFAESTFVDLTISGIVSDLGKPPDLNASFHYDGIFDISTDVNGNTIGSFSGQLTGTYYGQPVTGNLFGTLEPVTGVDPDFDGTGSATEPGTGNKLDVSLHVKVDDKAGTASVDGKVGKGEVKGKDLTKTHDDKRKQTTYDGQVKFKDKDYNLTVKVDDNADPKDGKRHYTSALYDNFFAYDNGGTISQAQSIGQEQQYVTSVDVVIAATPVPEPSNPAIPGLGVLGLLGYVSRRRAGHRK